MALQNLKCIPLMQYFKAKDNFRGKDSSVFHRCKVKQRLETLWPCCSARVLCCQSVLASVSILYWKLTSITPLHSPVTSLTLVSHICLHSGLITAQQSPAQPRFTTALKLNASQIVCYQFPLKFGRAVCSIGQGVGGGDLSTTDVTTVI